MRRFTRWGFDVMTIATLSARRAGPAIAAAALALFALSGQAFAQQQPAAAAPPAKPAKPAAAAPAAGGGGEGLKSRVDSLEEQLVDMQVLVGTLESLAKNGGGAPRAAAGGGGGADSGRVDALETQVRALTSQVQALSDQVRSMGGTPRRGDAAPVMPPPVPRASIDPPPVPQAGGAQGDAIGGLIDNAAAPPVPAAGTAAAAASISDPAGGPPVSTAALPPVGADAGNPKQLYETAYGYLLQRDYGAAEAAFDEFLKKYPSDSLAGNAQYWLGESHFVRGQYKAAASAFLRGYQTYAQSPKAPDSLLKLALSLDRLGQKDAACSSYSELTTKFPNAPQAVKQRAQSERQRVGCP